MSTSQSGIELLSPAGDLPSFYAAIHNGADAVYLGAASFGARASAGFDEEALPAAIRYAHLYGKRVYVTLNTLIKQTELPQAEQVLRFLDRVNADAVIVQDLGLMLLIKQSFPNMPVHASTQMSIHNASGARFLKDHGVSRVVLARECSLDTIREVSSVGIETEVFVHGAQCVSVSGQCLLSSHIGGRSGNRGRCAQPCRMDYEYKGQRGAWLSPRDLAQIDSLGDLARAGVRSFKIEGRLKRPEYVATVTSLYRKSLDRVLKGREGAALPAERKALLQIFNRGGFTQGWAFGQSDAKLINPNRVSHDGLPLGVITSTQRRDQIMLSEIKLNDALRHGDHLQIRGGSDQEMIYSGPAYDAGSKAVIRHHQAARVGDPVFKLADAVQLEQAKASCESPMPPIPLNASLWVKANEPSVLTLSSDRASISVTGEAPQPALSQAMDQSSSLKAIQKTGGSPFAIENYVFEAADSCFMPMSSLNALRRDALSKMEEAHIGAHRREVPLPYISRHDAHVSYPPEESALYVRSSRIDLIESFRKLGMRHFLYSPQDYTASSLIEDCKALSTDDFLCLPRQASDTTLSLLMQMAKRAGLSLMLDNAGQLGTDLPGQFLAGPGIPAWNTKSMELLRNAGCRAVVISTELSKQDISYLAQASVQTILPVYGRAMVMQLNHCPERTFRGLSGSQTSCRLCQAGQGTQGQYLKDRLGARFPLFPVRLPEGCLNALLFHTPLHLYKKAVGRHWLLDFTLEDENSMMSLVKAYSALLDGRDTSPAADIPLYAGRFDEGVL